MIYIFRKEMRKWKNILWLVLLSLVLGGAAGVLFRRKDPNEVKIASVNGETITLRQYTKVLKEIKANIDMYKAYAKAYGLPVDLFLNMEGLDNPEEKALEKCVKNKLVNKIKDDFKVKLNDDLFKELLAKNLPSYLAETTGKININAYQGYLHRLGMTIPEYEESKEEELSREVVEDITKNSYYSSLNSLKEIKTSDYIKKKFKLVVFPFESFLQKAKTEKVSDNKLMEFFQKNKSDYRIGTKAKAKYWVVSPKEYEKQIEVDSESLERYYERNKSSLFRIPPRVKLRRILFKESDKGKAKEILKKIKTEKLNFADLAKKYSQDKKTASLGGLVDFFDKGTYDPEFEKAAFRLKEPGDLSGLVKTKDGFEILKLEERISSSYKSLDKVKNEISETLKNKKALSRLQGDIKTAMYKAKSDKNAIEKFAKKINLTLNETDWLTSDDKGKSSIMGMLADRLLNSKKAYGYFIHDGNNVIYLLKEKKKSYYPSLKNVREKVLSDFYNDKAKKDMRHQLKLAKDNILSGKLSLKEVADKNGFEVVQTDLLTKKDSIKGLKVSPAFIKKMFLLSDPYQVLSKKDKDGKDKGDYYLVKLMLVEIPKDKKYEKIESQDLENMLESKNAFIYDAFIASLFRAAKIDREEISNSIFTGQEI